MKKLFLLIFLLSNFAKAQFVNTVSLGVSNMSSLGYTSPTYTVKYELEYNVNSFKPYLQLDWSPNRKTNEEFGWSGTSYVGMQYYIPEVPIFVDGCVGYSYTKAPVWSKSSFHPCLGIGMAYEFSKDLKVDILAKHLFKGTDEINELEGELYTLNVYFLKGYKITLGGGVWRFLDTFNHNIDYTRSTYGILIGKQF